MRPGAQLRIAIVLSAIGLGVIGCDKEATFNPVRSGTGAFDLVCTGVETVGKASEAFDDRVRIDLKANRYCTEPCTETYDISSVSETEITLDTTSSNGFEVLKLLNRETGAYWSYLKLGDAVWTWRGTCVPKPFSGFPSRKF